MSTDPWREREPSPGDFDEELAKLDPRYVERHAGDPDAKLMILVSVEGEDAERLQRLSEDRGKTSAEIVADLLRDADRPAA
jgi:hypothetical protein